ncbi:ankyrin repeat-containing domain protein [Melanogaster broomeanus]|nr:ankyrin repeat-containing domain protein [Melanogaster broomeanus]
MPFRDKIVPSLLEKADGMFRWVQLQLDRLTCCHTQGHIRTVLDTLPRGLYETYDRILTEVNKKEFDGRILKSALLWLVPSELRYKKLALCRFRNFSVKEYLLDEHLRRGDFGQYHLSSSIANNHLAKLCLDYLRMDPLDRYHSSSSIFNHHILMRSSTYYASRNAGSERHLRLDTFGEYVDRAGLLHLDYVMEINEHLPELMQSLDAYQAMYLEHNAALRPENILDGHSSLVYAIAGEKVDSARTLLSWGLDIKHQCPNILLESDDKILQPLEAAVVKNRATMVDLLLTHGCFIPPAILHFAFSFNNDPENGLSQVIHSLLKYGANANALTNHGDNPLHVILSRRAHVAHWESIAKALVSARCDPVGEDTDGIIPLCRALLSNSAPLVDCLLDKGARFEDYRYLHLLDMRWACELPWYHKATAAAKAAEHSLAVVRSITDTDVSHVYMMLRD